MSSLNKVILLGRLGRDPELRHTKAGNPVASFSMATGRGDEKDPTEWHNITAWGRTAELAAEYLQKGSLTLIEGRIKSREYTDKEGNQRKGYDIVAYQVTFMPRTMQGGGGNSPQGDRPKLEGVSW